MWHVNGQKGLNFTDAKQLALVLDKGAKVLFKDMDLAESKFIR
jgi:hypothetical protein